MFTLTSILFIISVYCWAVVLVRDCVPWFLRQSRVETLPLHLRDVMDSQVRDLPIDGHVDLACVVHTICRGIRYGGEVKFKRQLLHGSLGIMETSVKQAGVVSTNSH